MRYFLAVCFWLLTLPLTLLCVGWLAAFLYIAYGRHECKKFLEEWVL